MYGVLLSSSKMYVKQKTENKIKKKDQDRIFKKQVHQLHVDLKRGLLPYSILFLLKERPHYSLEIHKKLSMVVEGYFKIEKNIIYDNLRKFEQKGILGSFLEKSSIGAKRKYYFLTEFGEHLFDEIVINRLYPVIITYLTIMKSRIEEYGGKHKSLRKDLDRLQKLINEVIKN
jgi:DNA-binding PadR family transcriptional regulator